LPSYLFYFIILILVVGYLTVGQSVTLTVGQSSLDLQVTPQSVTPTVGQSSLDLQVTPV